MKFSVLYTTPSDMALCVGEVDVESPEQSLDAAHAIYGESQVVAVSPVSDPYVSAILATLHQIWPQLSAWPMCGCDASTTDIVVTIGRLLGKDIHGGGTAKHFVAGRSSGAETVLRGIEDSSKWQAKIGPRLHGLLVEDIREMVEKEAE